jgi:hypothetical protein
MSLSPWKALNQIGGHGCLAHHQERISSHGTRTMQNRLGRRLPFPLGFFVGEVDQVLAPAACRFNNVTSDDQQFVNMRAPKTTRAGHRYHDTFTPSRPCKLISLGGISTAAAKAYTARSAINRRAKRQ